MPIWSRLINIRYAIVDVEVGLKNHKIHDIGALRHDGATYHKASKKELSLIPQHYNLTLFISS